MAKFKKYARYTAKFTPRDNADYVLKPDAKPFIGRTLLLQCYGTIDGADRPRYAGDWEFVLDWKEATEEGLPIWYSHKDLSDITEEPRP